MNAFELMASALDISAIFDKEGSPIRSNTRFLSKARPEEIVACIQKLAASRGGNMVQLEPSRLVMPTVI